MVNDFMNCISTMSREDSHRSVKRGILRLGAGLDKIISQYSNWIKEEIKKRTNKKQGKQR